MEDEHRQEIARLRRQVENLNAMLSDQTDENLRLTDENAQLEGWARELERLLIRQVAVNERTKRDITEGIARIRTMHHVSGRPPQALRERR